MDVWLEDCFQLGLLEVVFLYCRWRAIKHCRDPACKKFAAALSLFAPDCSSWLGFREWILELAACLCSDIQSDEDYDPLSYVVDELDLLFNTLLHRRPNYLSNQAWLESINVVEVFEIIEWISRIHGGRRDPRIPAPPADYLDLTNGGVLEAMDRVKSWGLCPRRIWGIAANMQRGKLNLPALVPPHGFIHISPHIGHDDCTAEFCQDSVTSYTAVRQLHVCVTAESPEDPICHLTNEALPPFPENLLYDAAMNGIPTAWAFDGLSIVEPGQPFMAISHVWADGTGNGRDEFNRCLYKRFCDIAARLGCIGIWWDTICLPKAKAARSAAINNMHLNYKNAKVTLIHDLYIQNYRWVENEPACREGACFAFIISSWWTRSWTAVELANSGTVKVLFADLVVKDLDKDILVKRREPSSPCRQLATAVIRSLRVRIKLIDNLLAILGPRYTSMPRDKGVIAGLLVGINIPDSASRQLLYQNVVKEVKILTADNIFHGKETMTEAAYSWCPTDLLEIPVSRTPDASGHLSLRFEGGKAMFLLGSWDLCSLTYLKKHATFIWKGTQPLVEARVRQALNADRENVLLCEFIQQQPRGLIVKPMIRPAYANDEIGAQFIGSIDFVWVERGGWMKEGPRKGLLGRYSVAIGDTTGMEEIPQGMSAYDYLQGLWPEDTLLGPGGRNRQQQMNKVKIGPQDWWQ